MTFESAPLWDAIPQAPPRDTDDSTARYDKTQEIETNFRLYANSRDPDYRGLSTGAQLQRLAIRAMPVDGEVTAIVRYLNSNDRMNPVALQLLNADQISDPWDARVTKDARSRGATIDEGMEYDSAGRLTAIYVKEDWDKPNVRIPVRGPKSGRLFVIHHANRETIGQSRGYPELDSLVYELSRLTEYEIAELEAAVASAAWMASIESDKDSAPNPEGRAFVPKPTQAGEAPLTRDYGVKTVDMGRFALIQDTLAPGESMKMFKQERPNPNFEAFLNAFETRLCAAIGMPVSVFRMVFDTSYTSAQGAILEWWHNVMVRRNDFVDGFLRPWFEAWFSEAVKAGDIEAPGFNDSVKTRRAWLSGTWNGINRPIMDPVKEATASEKRRKMGDTTGEREAKVFNGSDHRENVERLKTENRNLAEANTPLDPEKYQPQQTAPANTSGGEGS
jgi:lambda family phage portal protein